jgi:hypothetical protein
MHPQIEALFDEAENRYLKPEELNLVNQYFQSLPLRMDAYRALRDRELDVMQWVADRLEAELPQETTLNLERSLKNALLMLRHCAMGMLLNDEAFVENRLLNWLSNTTEVYGTATIDTVLHRLLNQRLAQVLNQQQSGLLNPHLTKAQATFLKQSPTPATV